MWKGPENTYVKWSAAGSLDERLLRWGEAADSSRIRENEALSRHASLRIGGPARFWIEVGSADDLESLLAALRDDDFVCVGLGSDTLFPDQGIDGAVIRLVGDLATWDIEENEESSDEAAIARVMAGSINAHLVRGLLKQGWVGPEFLTMIPGSFGGAVALNAGTKETELKQVLLSVTLAVPDAEQGRWQISEVKAEELALDYRQARLPQGAMVLAGRVKLSRGDVEEARRRMKADKARRNRTQPYRLASVGSTFANPDGDFAGRLIEAAGLKGKAIGGARISEHHANFFINEEGATAEDFLGLMALARHRVRREFGVELRPEVKFVGFDGRARMRELEKELEDRDV